MEFCLSGRQINETLSTHQMAARKKVHAFNLRTVPLSNRHYNNDNKKNLFHSIFRKPG